MTGVQTCALPISTIVKEYNKLSDFTAIKCDGLQRLCELNTYYQDTSSDVIDLFYNGLSSSEISNINDCANTIYASYSKELTIRALNKINFEDSQIFKSNDIEGETVESINELKDTFSITKIKLSTIKKVLDYYAFDITMMSNSITFNGSSYMMKLKVLAKNKPFEVKITNVNFIITKKEGE